jgi:hypothetical protein
VIHKTKRTKKHENIMQGKNGIGITPRLKGIWNPSDRESWIYMAEG